MLQAPGVTVVHRHDARLNPNANRPLTCTGDEKSKHLSRLKVKLCTPSEEVMEVTSISLSYLQQTNKEANKKN